MKALDEDDGYSLAEDENDIAVGDFTDGICLGNSRAGQFDLLAQETANDLVEQFFRFLVGDIARDALNVRLQVANGCAHRHGIRPTLG